MNNRFKTVFDKNPLIGMVHLLPLPGSPSYAGSITAIMQAAVEDMLALQKGGADAFIIENFGDVPYEGEITREALAVMAAVCAQLSKESSLPFGINVQFNDIDSEWALALASAADFIRVEAFVENRIGIHGISYACAPRLMRLKAAYPAKAMIFADINVKHTFPLAPQPIEFSVHEAIESGADALIVTGLLTGQNPTIEDVQQVKEMAGGTPVIIGSGINAKNAAQYLAVSDGVIVGSSLKFDGDVNKRVDAERVAGLVESLHQ
ncbi:BtpA/SgcQ family protein [Pelolinea submarina]|uniref:Photosystem I assembly BtpA n=1 Tax=Pelolinea submarina TaxID=913107 RepID=A0A347ZPY4_9CHLR|nr:BtpA/SgcQ family protein [Pelolinea submarina]REG06306.1 hypothetical protein DFR64_2739 [Pelolinea submarina]BBB47365.1 hypothetical protein Pelsub_P0592 [Pelolinea submarina]